MPSSLQRHRIEIDHRLYAQLHELATREGYPVSRFVDKLLFVAVQDYIGMRRIGRYPFAGDGLRIIGDQASAGDRAIAGDRASAGDRAIAGDRASAGDE